ncbi:MAG TPA: sigma-54-dependent Fis family transcriptional regulator, partial [Myxococcaceae bacterium]|nr:sigma-54-dependent Fis family transcriptional regulator [Myxococcaceae bacterium]
MTLGEVVAVVRMRSRPLLARRALAPELLRERLQEEVERSLRYGRPLSLLMVRVTDTSTSLESLDEACVGVLGPAEVFGWLDASHLLLLLPEVSDAPDEEGLRELVEVLGKAAP